MHIHLQNRQVKSVNQVHRAKIKVDGAKSVKSHSATPYVTDDGAVSLQLQ